MKTAYKLVPGIFYRIILFKKMFCCAMEMKLGMLRKMVYGV